MRHILYPCILFTGALLSSCSPEEIYNNQSIKKFEASICSFDFEDGATRTSYTLGSNGYEAVWATGDVLGIYPVGGDQVAFPISDGIGTTTAVFDGGAWALRGTYQYAAYYPFSNVNYTISETAIPVTYFGQKQNSNNSTTHLAKYDYMAAAATQPSLNGSVTLPFRHLGSYLLMSLTLPKAGTYTQLTLTSSQGAFITQGTVDISASTPSITPTRISASITMNLDNIVLTSDNLVLTLNMLIAPVDLTGSTIEIVVKDNKGNTYTNSSPWTRTKAFAANTTCKVIRTLQSQGTSGNTESGEGMEEDGVNMHNGHEFVDLGLSSGLLWATCNVGAEKSEDFGGLFAWGETTTKTTYDWSTYKYCEGSFNTLTKYCSDLSYGSLDNKAILDLEDDAAHVNWGGNWRMPTKKEFDELRNTNNCTWTWSTLNGVKGYKITSNINNDSIFLPAAGYFSDLGFYDVKSVWFLLFFDTRF